MKASCLFFLAATLLALSACSSHVATEHYPSKPLQIVAPATPDGGWDLTARAVQNTLSDEHLTSQPIRAIDIPGAGGETGWKFVKDHGPNVLAVNSSLILTNYLLGRSNLTYQNFTPIAILEKEWETVAVPKDSPFRNIRTLMEKLKADPSSLRIGVAPILGNDDQIAFVKAAKAYGVDVRKLNFIVYQSGGDEVNALLHHYVDAGTMSVSEVKPSYLKGDLNMLVVSSPKELKGLEGIQTWKEAGINVVFLHWRGLMGPPNMTETEIAYWNKVLGKMVQSKEWKRKLAENEWEPFYKNSGETEQFLSEQNRQYAKLLKAVGLAHSTKDVAEKGK